LQQDAPPPADPVVAIIGARHITRSELDARVKREPKKAPKDALDDLVNEELMQHEADRLGIKVSDEMVERAIAEYACADPNGCHESYRRQLLEALLMQRRAGTRMNPSEDDVRAEYTRWAASLAPDDQYVDVDTVGLPGAKRAEAERAVARARGGADLCAVATCEARGMTPLTNVVDKARPIVAAMKVGDVSDPVEINGNVIVVRLKRRGAPPFADVQGKMRERARNAVIARERAAMLDELRAAAHVELKL
jgi:parvulin-like peptidyl-prolyl isomerase